VKLTRTEYGLSRRTSRTISYRLPPGEQVPKYTYQFEQAWKRANESPAQREAREARAANRKENQARRAAALKAAPRRTRVVYNVGCGVLVVAMLAAIGLAVAGLVVLTTNPCFFKQFPPASCPVASIDPPGAALGWHLIFGGLAAVLVVLAAGAAVTQSLNQRGNQQAIGDAREAARRNDEEERRVKEAMAQYLAEFRAQGYAEEAAEALARKRLRDEGPSPRVWLASDIESERQEAKRKRETTAAALEKEREEAELRRKIDAGELARCPGCREYAPVSQGVILAHRTGSDASPCEGEGTILGNPKERSGPLSYRPRRQRARPPTCGTRGGRDRRAVTGGQPTPGARSRSPGRRARWRGQYMLCPLPVIRGEQMPASTERLGHPVCAGPRPIPWD
jgi:hypothetical protein